MPVTRVSATTSVSVRWVQNACWATRRYVGAALPPDRPAAGGEHDDHPPPVLVGSVTSNVALFLHPGELPAQAALVRHHPLGQLVHPQPATRILQGGEHVEPRERQVVALGQGDLEPPFDDGVGEANGAQHGESFGIGSGHQRVAFTAAAMASSARSTSASVTTSGGISRRVVP